MSSSSIRAFLEKLDKELEVTSPEFRKEKADHRPHTFRLSASSLYQEIIQELKATNRKGRNITITSDIDHAVRKESEEFVSSLSAKLKTLSRAKDVRFNKKASTLTNTNIVFTFVTLGGPNLKLQPWEKDPGITFQRIKKEYEPEVERIFKNLKQVVKDSGQKLGGAKSKFLHLSHKEGEGIFETALAEAYNDALATSIGEAGAAPASIDADLAKLGLDLSIRRNSDTDTMEVFLGGATRNEEEGNQSAQIKLKLQKQIKKILTSGKLEDVRDLEGSDSFNTKKRKQTIETAVSAFADIKGAKVVSKEATKAKKGHAGRVSRSVKKGGAQKGKPTKLSVGKVKSKSRAPKPKSLAYNPMVLVAQINARLPAAVQDNMVSPALQNRSGRFAASVRVVDVLQTPKGFPSIGYTYRRDPYETFELGNAQGSAERDPRNLIDRTIRELAVELTMGRIFTRRV